ncbi:MAG: peptidoglycan DD-metalloendopeptidase family protein [Ruminococcaceae bacterium]|nr:peptidoglycan DD-metalloendopeptidase family protein [Oscillospiraceae bacterium]
MHTNRSTLLVRFAAFVLCLIMAMGLMLDFTAITPVYAQSTASQLDQARQSQTTLADKLAQLEQESAQLANSKNKVSGHLNWLNNRSEEQRRQYAEKSAQLAAAYAEMAAANQAYIDACDNLANKQVQYRSRLQTMFSHRQKSYLQIFIESGNIKNFFTTIQFMAMVAESDQLMIDDLTIAQDDADLQQQVAAKTTEDMTVVVSQIEAQMEALKQQETTTLAELESIQLKMSRAAEDEEALTQEALRLDGEITALQQKLEAELSAKATESAKATAAAQATAAAKAEKNKENAKPKESVSSPSASSPNSRGWVWPYPGDTRVYSPYGWRLHPVYKVRRFHSGVDLGGSYGRPIVAARDGKVIIVSNPVQGRNKGGSGYGNYVVIAHAGGLSTLYGHMKETLVKNGQSVKAGDRIGLCGSTGTSTGPHVHFEVRTGGSTKNPMSYIG